MHSLGSSGALEKRFNKLPTSRIRCAMRANFPLQGTHRNALPPPLAKNLKSVYMGSHSLGPFDGED